ncbi:hypothetical protein [Hymenobacter sp. PAMC 26628]|uniref:hypothetical protein n=1 Tax=Hymenobacter sp. PAMC 26628 TaxID=1484118 RepID=UPI0007704E25|nr:hypothetical protein [Hymenobacter sp. PAMC 26628]AMJ66630.1 hypothetical protein AXW84_15255 [Hymenobacter sp. PAMC 26628]
MKKSAFLAALGLGTALLGGCENKSGGDGDSTSQGSPGSDTTNPSSKVSADSAAVPRADSAASAPR